jgi:DNA topoisomerase-3
LHFKPRLILGDLSGRDLKRVKESVTCPIYGIVGNHNGYDELIYHGIEDIHNTNYLVPTKQGINTIKVIPSDLYSPKITADWEERIAKIVDGKLSEQDFMNTFESFIHKKIVEVKSNDVSGVDFSYEREVFGKCPWCGGDVHAGQGKNKAGKSVDSYYCSNKCGFYLQKDNIIFVSRTKRNLTTSQIKNLIDKGSITASCVSKNDVKYKGNFKLSKSPKGYTTLEFDFVNEKKGKR